MLIRVLTDEQIQRIHETSLAILERAGVLIPHEGMLSRFADMGATVDRQKHIVKIPPDLVMNLVKKAGKSFTLYGRDLTRKCEFGYGKRNHCSIGGEASWLDDLCQPRRWSTLADVATGARFSDALQHINLVGAMADPHEIDVRYRPVQVMAQTLKNTTKPIIFWFFSSGATKYLVEMMIALRGSIEAATKYPVTCLLFEPISPLRYHTDEIDLLFEAARLNLPVQVGPMAQMGISAPATIAATVALENAECLAGICVTQLVRPGLPVCYSGVCHAFDMKTTQLIFSGPEQALFGVAVTQMGKFYGFPVEVNTGFTDSKRIDGQAGLEAGITLMVSAAAGADHFGHMGISGVDQAASLDSLLFQHEVISFVESTMREIEVSDETLALDEIIEVGPGGRFIDREHTIRHFKKELWFPTLLDRRYYQQWLDSGAIGTEQRVRELRDKILRTHVPEPMSPELERALDEVVAAARRDLAPEVAA